MRNVNIVARYEAKLLRRDVVFLGFVVLAMIGISLWQATSQGGNNVFWYKVALPSSFPFFNMYYYSLIQVLIGLFVCAEVVYRERKKDAMEVFLCRPFRNSEYCIGRFWGIFKLFLLVNVCVLFVCMYLNIWVAGTPFNIWMYVFYLLTLSVPTLVFILGTSLWIAEVIKSRPLSILALIIICVGVYLYLDMWQYGVFDFWGRAMPNMFSDITGHPDLRGYLLHRLAYLSLGIAGILFWIASMNRLRDRREYRKIQRSMGGVLVVISAVCLAWYWNAIHQREVRSEQYRQVYVEYQSMPKVRIVNHDIAYEWKDGEMMLNSHMMLQNRNDEAVQKIVLYLNPELGITSLEADGKEMEYHREKQIILIERSLLPGDCMALNMAYRGKIDEAICYPDIPLEEQLMAGRANVHVRSIFNNGVRYAFADEHFTLLHPECLWYPVAVPPVNLISPYAREINFTNYSLRVKAQEGQRVLSQGASEDRNEEVFFKNEQKLPGISLCIGDYHKKEINVGDVQVEFYYHPGHEEFFEGYTELSGEKLSKELVMVKSRLEARTGRNYPFHKLAFVESPVSFVSFPRKWKTSSEFVQPEMIFFSERGTNIPGYYPMSKHKVNVSAKMGDLDSPEKIYSVERMGLQSLGMQLHQKMYDIMPMYFDYTSFLSSGTYPAINMLFNNVFTSKQKYASGITFVTPIDIAVVEYLKEKSLREVFTTDSLSDRVLSKIFEMQATTLKAYLSTFIELDELYQFSEKMAARSNFEEITIDQFAHDFQSDFGIDLLPILDKLYHTVGLPVLDIQDIRARQIEGEGFPKYQVSFKVRNVSDIDGIITCVADDMSDEELELTYGNSIVIDPDLPMKEWNFVIPARACKEVKLIMKGEQGYISTNLAANIPHNYNMSITKEGISKTKEFTEGIFDIDSSHFHVPGVIIVDNRSDRFQLVDSGERKRLPFLAKERKSTYKIGFENKEWTEVMTTTSYGMPVRSAFSKLAGEGNSKAIWTVDITDAGKYEVFFYHQLLSMSNPAISSGYTGSLLHYKICSSQMNEEIIVEADIVPEGWVSLGKYEFPAGQVQITLDDRGGEIKRDAMDNSSEMQITVGSSDKHSSKRQLIIADAVKFVRVE